MPANRAKDACCRGSVARRFAWLLCLAVIGVSAAPATATAEPVYRANSTDGAIGIFSTSESLVPGDTDHQVDVYERSFDESVGQYVTREISIGPKGGNDAQNAAFDGASADGTKVFFTTEESLVSADTDKAKDIYMRDLTTNTTTLVSQGAGSCQPQGCGNSSFDASFDAVTPSGNRLFFRTEEKLAEGDTDNTYDMYMRDLTAGTTTLVSRAAPSCASGGCGNGPFTPFLEGISTNGNIAVFRTDESLTGEDTDEFQDIYVRNLETETTSLVSIPGTCPSGVLASECTPTFPGMTKDGSHIYFETQEQVGSGDTDKQTDVYDWSAGTVTRVSTGPDGGNDEGTESRSANAHWDGVSADGSTVYFDTEEQVDPVADTDESRDIYARSGTVTTLVSTSSEGGNGPHSAEFKWVSPDGSSSGVIFSTDESLRSTDTDTADDVYLREGGETKLLSIGPQGGNGAKPAFFRRASHDGSRVFFVTEESLLAEDTDSSADIYERSGETTTRVSIGPEGGNGPNEANIDGISMDGQYTFFTTTEHLTEADTDAENDVYVRTPTGTILVSTGNLTTFGPRTPTLTATNPASPNASTTPAILGTGPGETSIKVYTTPDCSTEPVATGTVEQLETTGIAVSVAVGSTTSFRATAEAEGIVSPCSAPIAYKQEDPPPPPEEGSGGGGSGGGSGGGGSTGGSGGTGSGSGSGSNTKGGVTYVTPETTITFGPSFKTRKRRPVFRFDDSTGQPGSSFLCRIDRHRWASCNSPQKLRKLVFGKHTFQVKAVNALGVFDPQPDRRTFRVVR